MPTRKYERSLEVVPNVDLFDWQLLEQLFGLFEDYKGANGSLKFHVADKRGESTVETLAELKQEFEGLDEPYEWTLRVSDEGSGGTVWLQVWTDTRGYQRGSKFTSTREADVVYVKERVAALFDQAHLRREARVASERQPKRVPGFLKDVSAQAIGSAAGVGIVAVAVAAWAIFFR